MSSIILFETFHLTLNNSIASDWMFIWQIANDLSLLSKFLKELILSLQTICNNGSCKSLTLLLTALLWSIHIKGQCPNFDSINAFIKALFFQLSYTKKQYIYQSLSFYQFLQLIFLTFKNLYFSNFYINIFVLPKGHIFVDSPSIWRQNSKWNVCQNFINFERRIHMEIMTSIRRGNFDVDSILKSTKYRRVFHVGFFVLFRHSIDVTSVLPVSVLSFSNIFCWVDVVLTILT